MGEEANPNPKLFSNLGNPPLETGVGGSMHARPHEKETKTMRNFAVLSSEQAWCSLLRLLIAVPLGRKHLLSSDLSRLDTLQAMSVAASDLSCLNVLWSPVTQRKILAPLRYTRAGAHLGHLRNGAYILRSCMQPLLLPLLSKTSSTISSFNSSSLNPPALSERCAHCTSSSSVCSDNLFPNVPNLAGARLVLPHSRSGFLQTIFLTTSYAVVTSWRAVHQFIRCDLFTSQFILS